nr:TadE/TadG family type IV pilus assembly protein [Aurantiacibacter sp. 219JJ12-13]MDP5262076.1 pilus assembly protein [Aurantiacibacter sp. 219JJ12-13]
MTGLGRLGRDQAGNVAVMMGAALFPLLALIGGGVDMGRGYLAQVQLQQACDAGVLAARQRLGASAAVNGNIPDDVATTGQRFFNINFRDGIYATQNRTFVMTLESDYAISGNASVDVPTTLMRLFGQENMDIGVSCEAILNFGNLDVMMVVDTTGSMRHTNRGDSLSRLDSLKQTIRNFYAQVEAGKAPGTTIRYGFVPYATNVNVGHLLQDDWVVDSWTFQGREDTGVRRPNGEVGRIFTRNWSRISGERSAWSTISTYAGTWHAGASADQSGYYSCDGSQPANSYTYTDTDHGRGYTQQQAEPRAVLHIQPKFRTQNGTRYRTRLNGSICEVQASTDTNYVQSFEEVREVPSFDRTMWLYTPVTRDVSNWRTETEGCIEERDTYRISDYDNVDFTRALDLDIDLVPTAGDARTQWRPRYPEEIYVRRIEYDGNGDFDTRDHRTIAEYVDSGTWWFSDCPAPARKLQPMTSSELNAYLATLTPYGATYHDIGMIWGGRLLSPTGIFAGENADTVSAKRSRHMIWLTDGQTEPYDLAYGVYGVDGLDQRRWDPGSSGETLSQVVEKRFGVACEQVKNRNITVWVIAFGTGLTDLMTQCAGPGRSFEASNAEQLNDAFETIAKAMSELRITD